MPAKRDWPYGSLIEQSTGRVRWLAPTTIQKGDPNDAHGGGCQKRIFYRYRMKFPEPEREWSNLGNQCHAEIQTYLETDTNTLGPISSACAPFIPTPKPLRARPSSLLVEHDIGNGSLEKASFFILPDVPMVGYTDVIDTDPDHIDRDASTIHEPDVYEVLDWKFGAAKKGSDRDFSLRASDLPDDTQIVTYCTRVIEWTPRIDKPIRASHVYTNTKGKPYAEKETLLIPRERLLHRWEYVKSVARTIVDVMREVDPEKVPGNPYACESFGGCPYAEICSTPKSQGLDVWFEGEIDMSVMDTLNLPGLTPNTPATGPVVEQTPAGVAANLGLDVVAQMAAFANPSAAPAVTIPEGFAQAVDFINSRGYGMPPLAGACAKAYSALMLQREPNSGYRMDALGYNGTGDLGKTVQVTDPMRLVGIAREIAPLPVKPGTSAPSTPPTPAPAAAPLGLVSPETPASDPAKAALPVEGFANPAAVTPGVSVPGLIASVPASVAAPILANAAPTAAPTNVAATVTGAPTVTEEAPKAKRGRPPGSGKKKEDPSAANTLSSVPTSDDARWLFINALPNVSFDDCARFVAEWANGIAKHYKLTPFEDIRTAGNDSPLGYGKGLAALSAVAKRAASALPAGAYYLDTRDSDLARAVAEGFTLARVQNADGTDGEPVFDMIVKGTR